MFSKCTFCGKRRNLTKVCNSEAGDFYIVYTYHEDCLKDVVLNPDKYTAADWYTADKIHGIKERKRAWKEAQRDKITWLKGFYS